MSVSEGFVVWLKKGRQKIKKKLGSKVRLSEWCGQNWTVICGRGSNIGVKIDPKVEVFF